MKYFSDVTNEVYDTLEALQAAELLATETTIDEVDDELEVLTEPMEELPVKPTKKQLAAKVDEADQFLVKANSELALAEKRVEELSQEYLKACDEILRPAKQKVKDAQKAKYDAIAEFNQEYGAYQVLLTGPRAADEMIRAINEMNARTANMFRHFWI